MAKIPLRLDAMIDGEELRVHLAALTAERGGDGSSPDVRTQVRSLVKARIAEGPRRSS
jgi:[protein-PII] uridylyltransferase